MYVLPMFISVYGDNKAYLILYSGKPNTQLQVSLKPMCERFGRPGAHYVLAGLRLINSPSLSIIAYRKQVGKANIVRQPPPLYSLLSE